MQHSGQSSTKQKQKRILSGHPRFSGDRRQSRQEEVGCDLGTMTQLRLPHRGEGHSGEEGGCNVRGASSICQKGGIFCNLFITSLELSIIQ